MKKITLGFFLALAIVAVSLDTHAATRVGPRFTELHGPAASTLATITHAAETGRKHVADCIIATFAAGASAPTAITVNVLLRDGLTTAGTILFSGAMSLPATAGASAAPIQMCGLAIHGTTGNAMTLEFSASGGANTTESVFLQGRME